MQKCLLANDIGFLLEVVSRIWTNTHIQQKYIFDMSVEDEKY